MNIWVQIRGVYCHLPWCWVWGEAGRAGLSSGQSKKNKIHGKQNARIRSASQPKVKTLWCVNDNWFAVQAWMIYDFNISQNAAQNTTRITTEGGILRQMFVRTISSQINVSLVCHGLGEERTHQQCPSSVSEQRTHHLSLSHVLDQGNHGDRSSVNSTPPPSLIKNHEPLSEALQ